MYLWLEQKQSGSYSFFWILVNLTKRFVQWQCTVRNNKREHIQEQQPSQFHCYNRTWVLSIEWTSSWSSTRLMFKWKNGGGPWLLKAKVDDAVLQVCEYCIILTMKMVSVCLSYFFEEMLSMQFFWNTQGKADYPRPM